MLHKIGAMVVAVMRVWRGTLHHTHNVLEHQSTVYVQISVPEADVLPTLRLPPNRERWDSLLSMGIYQLRILSYRDHMQGLGFTQGLTIGGGME